jgi:DNA-binding transcriptional ArsR family regulator
MYYSGVRRQQQDRIFRAVADPTRRSILQRLHLGELTVGDLCEPFRITQPSLSKHLAVLRRSKLITARRSGRHRYYRLDPEPLEQIAAWAAQFRDVRDPYGHVWRLTKIDQRKET